MDPGGAIRINYNTDTIVKNGGSVAAWQQEVQTALDEALITSTVDWSQNNNTDGMLKLAQRRLGDAIGKANVIDAYQIGDKDFGRVRGTEVTLYVKPAKVAEAKRHATALAGLFVQYGYDPKAFSLKIEAEQR